MYVVHKGKIPVKINRRSFLKVFGGLAAVATLPSNNTPASLPVIPVQATTAPTVAVQELAQQIDEIIKPVSAVVQTVESALPYTGFPELGHHGVSVRWTDPVVYINGKQLPAHRMTCRLEHHIHSRWMEYDPKCELTIDGQVYGDAAKEQILDYPLETPIDVSVQLSNGMVYKGQGDIAEFYEEHSSYEYTYHIVIPMWDVVTLEDRWVVN